MSPGHTLLVSDGDVVLSHLSSARGRKESMRQRLQVFRVQFSGEFEADPHLILCGRRTTQHELLFAAADRIGEVLGLKTACILTRYAHHPDELVTEACALVLAEALDGETVDTRLRA